jgi:hypothetical protein
LLVTWYLSAALEHHHLPLLMLLLLQLLHQLRCVQLMLAELQRLAPLLDLLVWWQQLLHLCRRWELVGGWRTRCAPHHRL